MRTILAAALTASAALAVIACGPPVKNTPVAEIPKLTTLDEVMDNQATTADPQFKKIGNASFTDEDFAAFAEAAQRLAATSLKTKDFSKGPDFDALAMKLNGTAEALGKAAEAKDGAAANAALTEMKATCKECHSKFR
ncbi:MAG: cytochrome c [Polyangiaceae bacterium]